MSFGISREQFWSYDENDIWNFTFEMRMNEQIQEQFPCNGN